MNKDIIIIGAGGHSKVILDLIELNGWNFCGYIEKKIYNTQKFQEDLIIGDDSDLKRLYKEGIHYVAIGIGHIGNYEVRNNLYKSLKKIGYILPNLVHPSAIVCKSVTMGEGNVFMAGAIVNAMTCMGNINIINSHATVEHNVQIEDNLHLAPGSIILGNVYLKRDTFIGAGSVVLQGRKIEESCIIGAGSIVIKDINKSCVVVGNPGRVIKER